MIIFSDFNEKKILNLLRKGGGPISENGNEADQKHNFGPISGKVYEGDEQTNIACINVFIS